MYEFLDEIFFLIKNGSIRALETLNKSTACALLNYLTDNLIYEDVYFIMNKLLSNFIKREYFTNTAISLNSKNTVHNSFMIILFNNIEMNLKYMRKLK